MNKSNRLAIMFGSGGIGLAIIFAALFFARGLPSLKTANNPTPTGDPQYLEPTPFPTPDIDKLQYFHNAKYKLYVAYPPEFIVVEPNSKEYPAQSFLVIPNTPIQTFAIDLNKYPKSNLQRAYLSVSVGQTSSPDKCAQFTDIDSELKPLTRVVIRERDYYGQSLESAGGGSFANTRMYHTLYNNNCYEALATVLTSDIQNYDKSLGITAVNEDEIWNYLGVVISSIDIGSPELSGLPTPLPTPFNP